MAEWVQAKLWLREGKLAKSAEAFSRVLARLPLTAPERDRREAPLFVDSLWMRPMAFRLAGWSSPNRACFT